ncbi:nucleotidyltransferase domain-containing protein [Streptomyces sp. NPDC001351]|uniref:nucleotidyltransferase domain-containing protein n=1 Tax=Streptomyces sp. NPDC001351 TaxID=3364564 RepID=UPI003696FB06
MTFDIRADDVLKELGTRLDDISGVRTAFVGGSLVEGFGNATSDVDLLVLVDEDVAPESLPLDRSNDFVIFGDHRIWVSEIRGQRLDIEFRRIEDFEQVKRRLVDPSAPKDFNRGWLEFFHHLRIGIPVVRPEEFEGARDGFPWPVLGRVLVEHFEYDANSSLDDAAGAITAQDTGTALLASRATLGAAVEALLASVGSTNPRVKWRFRKLRQFRQLDLLDRYLHLEVDTSSDDADLLARARERVTFAQDLLLEAQANLFRLESVRE